MKSNILIIIAMLACVMLQAQNTEPIERRGFTIGLGIGGGVISISDSRTEIDFDDAQGALVFPNLKIGYMLNQKTALLLTTSGMIYDDYDYDRNFETLLPSVQYWVSDKVWLNGGVGLAIDMPALYDVEDNINDDYHFGCGVGLSAGYEMFREKNCTMDLQIQTTLGRTFLDDDAHRDAATFSIGIGFNWY